MMNPKAESFTRRHTVVLPRAGKFRFKFPMNGMRFHKFEAFDASGVPHHVDYEQDGLQIIMKVPDRMLLPGIAYIYLTT